MEGLSAVTGPAARRHRDFFSHTLTFAALAAGAGTTGIINIPAAYDFIWSKAEYFADVAAAAQTESTRVIPLCTILLTDSGSRRQLMDAPIPLTSIFGSPGLPFILPVPRLFARNSSITVAVANFSAATAYNLRLVLIGVAQY